MVSSMQQRSSLKLIVGFTEEEARLPSVLWLDIMLQNVRSILVLYSDTNTSIWIGHIVLT
jgi:hypothetical protein